ncbi:histidine kinase [Afifella sp. IM 167]|nr:histidine kinase [Afifella sp. IM 167]MBZ8133006.1 histidine kinase [Afifella sp. IM 167]
MPSLFRFLFVIAVLAGIVYGGMLALTILVEPNPREMSVRIPADRVNQ